jgi:hypothetical protein
VCRVHRESGVAAWSLVTLGESSNPERHPTNNTVTGVRVLRVTVS